MERGLRHKVWQVSGSTQLTPLTCAEVLEEAEGSIKESLLFPSSIPDNIGHYRKTQSSQSLSPFRAALTHTSQ